MVPQISRFFAAATKFSLNCNNENAIQSNGYILRSFFCCYFKNFAPIYTLTE